MHLCNKGLGRTALVLVLGCPVLCAANGGAAGQPGAKLPASSAKESGSSGWDTVFLDRSGDRPLHFVAHYLDGRGQVHRLEEWRLGQRHLRRLTDDRIDLHADATSQDRQHASAQPLDYLWNIIDLQKRTVHRVSSTGMLHLGMLYSYYSMAHVLTRPAGAFTVEPASAPALEEVDATSPLLPDSKAGNQSCAWWQIRTIGQPAVLVCWSSDYGMPLRTYMHRRGRWRMDFAIASVDTRPILPAVFQVSTAGFQVRDLDEIQSED